MTLFHVGYPKTATTTLQRNVFGHVRGLYYLPKEDQLYGALYQHIIWSDDGEYLEHVVETALDAAEARSGLPLLVSQESFIGAEGADSVRTARRLQHLRPDAQVLIVVRRQRDMLRSIYGHYVNLGGYRSLGDVLDGKVAEFAFRVERMEYDKLIGLYVELFGVENVRVVTFEELRADFDATVGAVAKWAGGEYQSRDLPPVRNPSLSPRTRALLRTWNHWFRESRLNPSPRVKAVPFPMDQVLQARQARRDRRGTSRKSSPRDDALLAATEERFRESNRRLEELVGVDVAAYGYLT